MQEHKRRRASTHKEVVSFVIEKEKLEKLKYEHIQSRYVLKAKRKMNKESIIALESQIMLIKGKINFVKGLLGEYYTNLLKHGTDTRDKGLVWIVQKLYKLGLVVGLGMYPDYLDFFQPDANEYLTTLATKETNANRYAKHLERTRKALAAPKSAVATIDQANHSSASNHRGKAKVIAETQKVSQISRQLEVHIFKNTLLKVSVPEYEKELIQLRSEIENLKKETAKRLGYALSNVPITTRRMLLPKSTAALFGEAGYEIEVAKHMKSVR